MTEIGMYFEEYYIIAETLLGIEEDEEMIYKMKDKDCIAIDRKKLEFFFEKNNYDETSMKLRIWRTFGLIESDKGRFSKSVRVKKEFKRMIVINLEPYRVLKKYNIPFKTLVTQ